MSDQVKPTSSAAIIRGLACRCPACGEGALFNGYLSVTPQCPNCSEDLSRLRAADGPAFMTMLFVCLLLIPTLWLGYVFIPNPLLLAAAVSTAVLVLTSVLLRLVKGTWLAIEWLSR
ncbi:DUF983 domain-containing protein [Ketogulonicigenium vulgare]|uniref:DUF983 domain-containing protein n=1 Tax=Ketogulonicigenium vulgare TaxID=92945 RepID=UPI0023598AD8|nr:DUF983 domain-containing protein [Ketogulonicigenium vulgare]